MAEIPVRKIKINSKEQSSTGFNIRDVGVLLDEKDIVHELHRHSFFFILALEKGNGVHEIDFTKYEVRDHSIFILRPGQVHMLHLRAGSTGYLLEFDLAFFQSKNKISDHRWKKATSRNYCKVEAGRFRKLHSTLGNVFEEFTSKQDGYIDAIKANLDLFFIEFVRESQDPKRITNAENGYTQDRYEVLMHLLEKNISSMKTVSEYAALLNLSSYQLNAITKASVGKTMSDLINEQIVLEAKRYLLATTVQVKEVADHLGYEDVSYFIRFFKKHTGLSPEAFRKNFK
jgi:AraC family transcriptional regulator, transcriptional activator of pobA